MYLYDTNIFLEILLGQPSAKKAIKSLEMMDEKATGYVTSFSLHAIEAIIGHKKRFEVITEFLSFVESHPFLLRYSTSTEEERKVSQLAASWKLDFDDALQFFVAKTNRLTLITFDRDFYKTRGVKIFFPS